MQGHTAAYGGTQVHRRAGMHFVKQLHMLLYDFTRINRSSRDVCCCARVCVYVCTCVRACACMCVYVCVCGLCVVCALCSVYVVCVCARICMFGMLILTLLVNLEILKRRRHFMDLTNRLPFHKQDHWYSFLIIVDVVISTTGRSVHHYQHEYPQQYHMPKPSQIIGCGIVIHQWSCVRTESIEGAWSIMGWWRLLTAWFGAKCSRGMMDNTSI